MGISNKFSYFKKLSFKYILAIIVSVSGTSLTYGYGNGVLDGIEEQAKILTRNILATRYSKTLSENEWGLIWSGVASIYLVGATIGAFLSPLLADKAGRKYGLIINSVLVIISAILGAICRAVNSFEILFVSRFISGFTVGVLVPIVSMYVSEISPKEIRGGVIAVHQFAITFGIFLSEMINLPPILGNASYWHISLLIPGIIAGVFIILFFFFPESPRYTLLTKKNEEEAKKALELFRTSPELVNEEIREMIEESKNISEENISWVELFRQKNIRKPLAIVFISFVVTQLTGINVIFTFSRNIYKSASIADDKLPYASMGTGIINCVATIIAIPFVDIWGRRPLLIWPLLSIIVSLILEVISLVYQVPILSVLAVYLFVISFAISFGIVPQALMVEYFTQDVRAKAAACGVLIANVSNFIAFWIFKPAVSNDAVKNYILLVFAFICLLGFIFLFLFLPETKNKTYNENSILLANWNTVFQTKKIQTTSDF